MATYVLTLNERTKQGKAIRALLDSLDEETLKLISLEEHNRAEEAVLATEIKKATKTSLLGYEESKREFARLRNALNK